MSAVTRSWPWVAAVLALALYAAVGTAWLDGYALDLGSLWLPAPRYAAFAACYAVLGGAIVLFGARGLTDSNRGARALDALIRAVTRPSDRAWVAGATAVALATPLVLRRWLLRGAPLTDDEAAYRFMAEVLATGRLWVPSPPEHDFFDHVFMINDGRFFAHNFLGWPALLAAFHSVGAIEASNAVIFALGVPLLDRITRAVASPGSARAATALYVLSPMLAVGAATLLSHTASTTALLAFIACLERRASGARGAIWSLLAAACFGVAFFIRPLTALGLGAPWWASWLLSLHGDARRLSTAGAALVPVAALGGLFLLVNQALTGSPWVVPYAAGIEYARANPSPFVLAPGLTPEDLSPLRFDAPLRSLLVNLSGLFRLNVDLFGWPSAFLLAVFAGLARPARRWWAAIATFLVAHAFQADAGIDSYGPVHFTELALPMLVLSAVGLDRLASRRAPTGGAALRGWAWLSVSCVVCVTLFLPVRWGALARLAENIAYPTAYVAAHATAPAVVLAPFPFAPACRSAPTEPLVFQRPNNDPELGNPILWANDLGDSEVARLAARFPARRVYRLRWTGSCEVALDLLRAPD